MFKHILVPLDGSVLAECVLPHAVTLARALGARITLLKVVELARSGSAPSWASDPFASAFQRAETQVYLNELSAHLQHIDLDVQSATLQGASPADLILDFIVEKNVDLVAVSSHGRSGLSRWDLGSVARKILALSPASTFLVRAYHPLTSGLADLRYRRLLVPLDGSQRSERVLPLVTVIAGATGAELVLAHIVRRRQVIHRMPLSREDELLCRQMAVRDLRNMAAYLDSLQAQIPAETRIRLSVHDDIFSGLQDLARNEGADLMVLSSHGCTGSSASTYGSVAGHFQTHGSTPLLVVSAFPQDPSGSGQNTASMGATGGGAPAAQPGPTQTNGIAIAMPGLQA